MAVFRPCGAHRMPAPIEPAAASIMSNCTRKVPWMCNDDQSSGRSGGHPVPIRPYLKDQFAFDPEVTLALSLAFDEVCLALFVPEEVKTVREAIADKIIQLARQGEHDPDRLRD